MAFKARAIKLGRKSQVEKGGLPLRLGPSHETFCHIRTPRGVYSSEPGKTGAIFGLKPIFSFRRNSYEEMARIHFARFRNRQSCCQRGQCSKERRLDGLQRWWVELPSKALRDQGTNGAGRRHNYS